MKYDTTAQKVSDYNAGAEYSMSDFTATVKTTDQADKISASYIHAVDVSTSVGALFTYDVPSSDRVFTLGAAHSVDRDVVVKGKINSNGILDLYYEQRLYNPVVKVSLSGEWNARNQSTVPSKAGIGLQFGEL